MNKSRMWDTFMQMVDEGKISIIVEGALDTIDGGEIVTDVGEIVDVIAEFQKNSRCPAYSLF